MKLSARHCILPGKRKLSVVLLNSMKSIIMANTTDWARNLKLWFSIAWAKSKFCNLWFYRTLPASSASTRIRHILFPVNSALSVILGSFKAYLLETLFCEMSQSILWKRLGSSHAHEQNEWHRGEVIYLTSGTGQNSDWTLVSYKGHGQLRCINDTTTFSNAVIDTISEFRIKYPKIHTLLCQ